LHECSSGCMVRTLSLRHARSPHKVGNLLRKLVRPRHRSVVQGARPDGNDGSPPQE
jgi:hypothetical protein